MGLSFKSMIKIIGILTLIEGVFMLPVVFTAIHFEEWQHKATAIGSVQPMAGTTSRLIRAMIFALHGKPARHV